MTLLSPWIATDGEPGAKVMLASHENFFGNPQDIMKHGEHEAGDFLALNIL